MASGFGARGSGFELQDHSLSPLHEPLDWRAKRDPKAKMIDLQSFLRKGVSLGCVGRIET